MEDKLRKRKIDNDVGQDVGQVVGQDVEQVVEQVVEQDVEQVVEQKGNPFKRVKPYKPVPTTLDNDDSTISDESDIYTVKYGIDEVEKNNQLYKKYITENTKNLMGHTSEIKKILQIDKGVIIRKIIERISNNTNIIIEPPNIKNYYSAYHYPILTKDGNITKNLIWCTTTLYQSLLHLFDSKIRINYGYATSNNKVDIS